MDQDDFSSGVGGGGGGGWGIYEMCVDFQRGYFMEVSQTFLSVTISTSAS